MMTSETITVDIHTAGENSATNITEKVTSIVDSTGVKNGLVYVSVLSTTSSILICEDENGLIRDLIKAAGRIAPKDMEYEHNAAWNDDNGRSHVKSSIIGQGVTVPISNGALLLGTWQSIFLFEFDLIDRKRTVAVTLVS